MKKVSKIEKNKLKKNIGSQTFSLWKVSDHLLNKTDVGGIIKCGTEILKKKILKPTVHERRKCFNKFNICNWKSNEKFKSREIFLNCDRSSFVFKLNCDLDELRKGLKLKGHKKMLGCNWWALSGIRIQLCGFPKVISCLSNSDSALLTTTAAALRQHGENIPASLSFELN